MSGVWLGLLAALSWGLADYLAQPAARNLGTFRASFYAQLTGLVLLLPYVWLTQPTFFPSDLTAWFWSLLTAVLGTAGGLAFYQSVKLGNLAVVAPIMGSYGAVTTVLAWWRGEHLSGGVVAGLLCALGAVILVSIPTRSAHKAGAVSAQQLKGIWWAIVAAVVLGVCFFVMGQELSPRLGGVLATFWMRTCSVLLTALACWGLRQSLALPAAGGWLAPSTSGIFSTLAILATALGLGRGEDSIVTVLGSMSIVITTLLALTILRERLTPLQWAGVVLAGVGLLLIGLK